MLLVANAARHASVVLLIQTKDDARCSLEHLVPHCYNYDTISRSGYDKSHRQTDRHTKCCIQLGLIQDQP